MTRTNALCAPGLTVAWNSLARIGTLVAVALLGSGWLGRPALAQKVELEALEINYGDIVKTGPGPKSGTTKLTAAVSADLSAQKLYHIAQPDDASGALVVRRGAFLRAGVALSSFGACPTPSLLLKDSASGRQLRMPLLSRADGLALTQATADALAYRAGAGCRDFNGALKACGFSRDERGPSGLFQGTLAADLQAGQGDNTGVGGNPWIYIDAVQARGTPYYGVVLQAIKDETGVGLRAAIGVWLPEHMPIGAYDLSLSCGAEAVGSPLSLVVLFNPYSVATDEAAPAGPERDAALADSDAQEAGPLRLRFGIDADDPQARDVALEMLAAFPLAARANPALVARIAQDGPRQLLAGVGPKGEVVAGLIDSAKLIQYAVKWNDATGHFDLWNGQEKSGGSGKILWGRWDGEYADGKSPGFWVAGTAASAWVAQGPTSKPGTLVGRWTFDEGHGLDTSHGQLPAHTAVKLQGTVHFVDDWQGETAFLKGAPAQIRFGTARNEYTVGAKVDAGFKASRPKYGQCWVFSSVTAGGKTAEETEALSTAEVFAAYKRDGGGRGQCQFGKCFCTSFVGDALLRNVGIPTRPLTNLDSARSGGPAVPPGVGPGNRALVRIAADGNSFAAIDFGSWAKRLAADLVPAVVQLAVQPDGQLATKTEGATWDFGFWNKLWASKQKTGDDSHWNFHVWTEAWAGKRTEEVRAGGDEPGKDFSAPPVPPPAQWWAVDATPQESATGNPCDASADPIATSACKLAGAAYVLVSEKTLQWFAFTPFATKVAGGDAAKLAAQ